MRTINISISDIEYNKFGLKSDKFSFSDLVDIISNELIKQRLNESVELAEKYGLSKMTMDDISKIKPSGKMQKIVLDTNVFVSALIQRSYPFHIVSEF